MDASKIAERLKNLRAKKGKTQDEVAQAVGISRTAYENYEIGKRIPRDAIKMRIAEYYDTDIVTLFFE